MLLWLMNEWMKAALTMTAGEKWAAKIGKMTSVEGELIY